MTEIVKTNARHFGGRCTLAAIALLVAVAPLWVVAQDADLDGMSDAYESFFQLTPTNATDGPLNFDDDTLSNSNEAALWTDPWEGDTDHDGFRDDGDSNAVSRAFIDWGEPLYSVGDEQLYTWPIWLLGASKSGGEWDTNAPTSWHVWPSTSNGVGSLWIDVDRAFLSNDVVLQFEYYDHTNASLYADLIDTNSAAIVSNLFGNVLHGANAMAVARLNIPFSAHTNSAGVRLRREAGEVHIYSTLLYVDQDADDLDADQEAQLETSDQNIDSDEDGLEDGSEVFTHHTLPNFSDSDGDGMNDGLEVLHGQDPLSAATYDSLPFIEEFETNSVYQGNLDGQNGWRVSPTGAAVVQANSVYSGLQAIQVESTDRATIQHLFVAPTANPVWLDFQTQVIAAAAPTGTVSGSAVYFVNEDGVLTVRNGSVWLALTNSPALSSGSWIRLTIRLDYGTQEWALYLNGSTVVENLLFASLCIQFSAFGFDASAADLDALRITSTPPVDGPDLDEDDMSDWWETEYFGSTDSSPSDDHDGDGYSEIYEFKHGGDPRNKNSRPAATHFVSLSGSHTPPFDTWAKAANTIQAALNMATNDYDIVLVADGTYSGSGNNNLAFPVNPIALHSDTSAKNCIIDGQNGYGVYMAELQDQRTVIAGFTIKNCGGQLGGAIYTGGASPTIRACTITQNKGQYGAGIFCGGQTVVEDCVITHNLALNTFGGGGGGVLVYGSPIFRRCIVANNKVLEPSRGGGFLVQSGTLQLENCIIADNVGGGLVVQGNAQVANCTIIRNQQDGGGVSTDPSGGVTIENSIVWANTPQDVTGNVTVTSSIIGGAVPGTGNIHSDPKFEVHGYWLSSNSPAIDAGVQNAVTTDWERESRWQNVNNPDVVSIWDIGADEFVDSDGDGYSDSWESYTGTDLNDPGSTPAADTDEDAMPDWWEQAHFGSVTQTVAVEDTDADGFDNYEEYLEDTDPLDTQDYAGVAYYVDDGTGNDSNAGSSAAPFKTISKGILSAQEGERVVIRPGTYRGSQNRGLDPKGKGIRIRGLAGHSTTTILDLERNGRGFTFTSGESSATIVSDLCIRNGFSNSKGGGVIVTSAAPVLLRCIIEDCESKTTGGGVYAQNSGLQIIACKLSGNIAAYGAAIYADTAGTSTIRDSLIEGNAATNSGICYISGSASPQYINNTIVANSGAAIVGANSSATIGANNTIAGNQEGLHLLNSATVTWHHNCVYGNRGGNYVGMADPSNGNGNISTDPKFSSSTLADFRLAEDSPCRDAGDASSVDVDSFDLAGGPRVLGLKPDMGGYEANGDPIITKITVVRVDASQNGLPGHTGGTWADAVKTISGAIALPFNSSTTVKEIWVKAGTYNENLSIRRGNIHIYGGFDGSNVADHSDRDPAANATIINGRDLARVITCEGVANEVLDGLIITNGDADGAGGGGILLRASSLTLDGCTVSENTASTGGGIGCYDNATVWIQDSHISENEVSQDGGGLFCNASRAYVQGSTFQENEADNGGGLALLRSTAEVDASSFLDNRAKDIVGSSHGQGGAIALLNAAFLTVDNSKIIGNRAFQSGALGVLLVSPVPTITLRNVTISENHSTDQFAIGNLRTATTTIRSSTLVYNTSGAANPLVALFAQASASAKNSIIWGNSGQLQVSGITRTYCDVQGGSTTSGNRNSYPGAVPGSGRLVGGSSIINQGDASTELTDRDDEPRWNHPLYSDTDEWDMGADEFVDRDHDQMADAWEIENFGSDEGEGSSDTDEDGISNADEYWQGTDPVNSDSNGDEVPDNTDDDADGMVNDAEEGYGTDPDNWDSDGDGMSDSWEAKNGRDPMHANDPTADPDDDGWNDGQESDQGTDPNSSDTDGDGVEDSHDADPLDSGNTEEATAENTTQMTLVVSDNSSSETERYAMTVGPFRLQMTIPGHEETLTVRVPRGKSYDGKLIALPDDDDDGDYFANVTGAGLFTYDDSPPSWGDLLGVDYQGTTGFNEDDGPENFKVYIYKVEFIDEIPDYSLDSNTDSDNFFLRELDGSNNPDFEALKIYYRVLPADMPVWDVAIKVYRGDTETLEDTLEGEKNPDESFKTGDNLLMTWDAPEEPAEEHPGFYRVQLEIFFAGQSEPVPVTTIEDADTSTDGWQCPQDCLAIHDLAWKHRPVVHLHSGEFSGPAIAEVMLDRADLFHDFALIPVRDVAAPVSQANLSSHNTDGHYLIYAGTSAQQSAARIRAPASTEQVMYHHGVYGAGQNYAYLQSWHFEPSSFGIAAFADLSTDPLTFTHDADWEMLQVAVRLADSSSADNKATWLTGYSTTASQHFRGQTLRWDEVGNGPTSRNQDYVGKTEDYRPNVYIANRTHATYFRPNAAFRFALTEGDCLAYQTAPSDDERDDFTGDTAYTYTYVRITDTVLAGWLGAWSTQGVIPNLRSPQFREASDAVMYSNPKAFNNRFLKSGNGNSSDPAYIP